VDTRVYGHSSANTAFPYDSLRRALGYLSLFLIVFFAGVTVYEAGPYRTGKFAWGSPDNRTDYTVYYNAGQAVLQGTDIYAVRSVRGWAYVYPPPFSIAMVPLSVLPLPLSVLLYYAICAGLMVYAAIMAARLAQPLPSTKRNRLAMIALPILLTGVWFGHGLARGQASVIVAFLVTAAVYWEHKGKLLAGAACLAGAVAIKLFPLSLLAYYAWRGRWKFVGTTLAAVLAVMLVLPAMVFGWQRNIEYLHEFKRTVVDPATMSEAGRSHYDLYDQLLSLAKPRNQALAPVLYRFFGGQSTPPISVLIAAVLAAIIWLAARGATPQVENLILGAVLIWVLLVSPVAEDHYYAMLLLPAAFAVSEVVSSPSSKRKTIAQAALVIYGVVNFSAMFGHPFEYYGVVCWAAVLMLILMLYLVRTAASPGAAEQASESGVA
jgi:hypothetical protein